MMYNEKKEGDQKEDENVKFVMEEEDLKNQNVNLIEVVKQEKVNPNDKKLHPRSSRCLFKLSHLSSTNTNQFVKDIRIVFLGDQGVGKTSNKKNFFLINFFFF